MGVLISQTVKNIVDNLSPFPEPLGFGRNLAPIMYIAEYANDQWLEGIIKPYENLSVDPAAKVLHYAQTIFEGMKAYCNQAETLSLFRPLHNFERFNKSANRMCMPELPKDMFFQGIEAITALCQSIVPKKSGQSLYLRPFMIGTKAELGLSSSDRYSFIVIASPSDGFHAGAMKVKVQRDSCRTAIGGTGAVKAGANYAISLYNSQQVKREGFHQPLWLDPEHRQYIEELSGMNLFFYINGELHTPETTNSFLNGITRNSIIDLAKSKGITVIERPMTIDDTCQSIKNGECTEVLACGTATIVSSISSIYDGEQCYTLPEKYDLGASLKKNLLDIQEGRTPDIFQWMHPISTIEY